MAKWKAKNGYALRNYVEWFHGIDGMGGADILYSLQRFAEVYVEHQGGSKDPETIWNAFIVSDSYREFFPDRFPDYVPE